MPSGSTANSVVWEWKIEPQKMIKDGLFTANRCTFMWFLSPQVLVGSILKAPAIGNGEEPNGNHAGRWPTGQVAHLHAALAHGVFHLHLAQEPLGHGHEGIRRPLGVPVDGTAVHQRGEPDPLCTRSAQGFTWI